MSSTTQIVVFTTSGCSYCAKAKRLLSEVAARPASTTKNDTTVFSLDVTAGSSTTNTQRHALYQAVADKFEHATFPLIAAIHHNPSNSSANYVLEFIGGYTEVAARVGEHSDTQALSSVFTAPTVDADEGNPQRHVVVLNGGDASAALLAGAEFASVVTNEGDAILGVPAVPLTTRQKLFKVFGLTDSTTSNNDNAASTNKIQAVVSEAEARSAPQQHPVIQSSSLHPELFVSMFAAWHADAKIAATVPRSHAWMTVLGNEARDRMALQQSATMLKSFTSLRSIDTILSVPLHQDNTIVANGPVSVSDVMRFVFYSFQVNAVVKKTSNEEVSSSVVVPMYLSNGTMSDSKIPQFAEDDLTATEYAPSGNNKQHEDVTTFLNYRPGFFCKMTGGLSFENEYERRLLGWSRPPTSTAASSPSNCWDEQLIGAQSVQRKPRMVWHQASLFKCVLEPYAALYSAHVAAVATTLSMPTEGAATKDAQSPKITMTAESLLEVLLRHDVIRKHSGGATAPPMYRWTGHVAATTPTPTTSATVSVMDTLAMPPTRWYASGTCAGPAVEGEEDGTGGGGAKSGGRMMVPFPPPHLDGNTMTNSEVRIIGQHQQPITPTHHHQKTVSDEDNSAVVAASAALRSVLDMLRDTFGKDTLGDNVPLSSHPALITTTTTQAGTASSGTGKGGVQYDALGQSATLAWATSALLAKQLGTYNTRINWNTFFTTSPRPTVTATLINMYNSLVTTKMAAVLGQHATHGKLPSSMMTQYKFFYSPVIAFSASSSSSETTTASSSSTLHLSLDDIENGILRGNRAGVASFLTSSGPFKSNDPRSAWSLQPKSVDYRIHAALNCGASSCPPVRVFDSEHLNEQLHTAFTAFVQSTTKLKWSSNWDEEYVISESTNQVKQKAPGGMIPKSRRLPPTVDINLSMIFKWYKEDFQHPLPTHYSQSIKVVEDEAEDAAITTWVSKLDHLKDYDRHVLVVIMRYLQPSKRKALLTLPHLGTKSNAYGDVIPLSDAVKVSYLPYDWSNDSAALIEM